MQKGFSIKTTPDPRQPYDVKVHGSINFNEAIELCLVALRVFMEATKEEILNQPENENAPNMTPEEKDMAIRAVLYDKAVVAFSMMVHEFFPEAEELKAQEDAFEEFIKQQTTKQQTETTN